LRDEFLIELPPQKSNLLETSFHPTFQKFLLFFPCIEFLHPIHKVDTCISPESGILISNLNNHLKRLKTFIRGVYARKTNPHPSKDLLEYQKTTMSNTILRPRGDLTSEISPIVMGGAAWSYQLNSDAETRPVIPVILSAFHHGIRTIDTSPYYEPSEKILGKALSDPAIAENYSRNDYFLMTKVGRIAAEEFNYSPDWVRKSVNRSLERFQTSYLDVVFCHDVEFVSDEAVVAAVATLWEFVAEGKIRYVGISGYPIDKLVRVAKFCKEKLGKPLDIVQNWGQLTLQNTKLRSQGLEALAHAGVKVVCSSSPLNIGLLRAQGVPIG
jgi:D-arabinose 1-dehydrogenase